MGFAKEGFIWVIPIIALTILSFYLNNLSGAAYWIVLFLINIPLVGISIFVTAFFRDPPRSPLPLDQFHPETSVLSPADGCVCAYEEENGNFAIYVEMHASEVHVTRAAIDGIVVKVIRTSGKHYPIYVFKKTEGTQTEAIRKNARVTIELKDSQNRPFLYQLVCGVIARRAKPYVKEGDFVKQGQKMGIIAFGSLTKITLPGTNYRMLVKVHEKVYGGQTIICERII